VFGEVQGVGYRYFIMRRAEALGVSGWVRNRSDGTVDVEAWGMDGVLDDLEVQLRQGPRWSRVDRVERESREGDDESPGVFQVRI
jgi:acylphosphatase